MLSRNTLRSFRATFVHDVGPPGGGYGAVTIDNLTATITDNDDAGYTIALLSPDSSGKLITTESGGQGKFSLVLNSQPTGTVTISGAITGNGGLTKAGGGILSLTGTNSYRGSTTVSSFWFASAAVEL